MIQTVRGILHSPNKRTVMFLRCSNHFHPNLLSCLASFPKLKKHSYPDLHISSHKKVHKTWTMKTYTGTWDKDLTLPPPPTGCWANSCDMTFRQTQVPFWKSTSQALTQSSSSCSSLVAKGKQRSKWIWAAGFCIKKHVYIYIYR